VRAFSISLTSCTLPKYKAHLFHLFKHLSTPVSASLRPCGFAKHILFPLLSVYINSPPISGSLRRSGLAKHMVSPLSSVYINSPPFSGSLRSSGFARHTVHSLPPLPRPFCLLSSVLPLSALHSLDPSLLYNAFLHSLRVLLTAVPAPANLSRRSQNDELPTISVLSLW
jgi:hypothetical protein